MTAVATKPKSRPAHLTPKDLLYPKQRALMDDPSQHIIAVTCRQWGKSTVTSGMAVYGCLTDPGCTWVCMSAGERQSLEWKAKANEWFDAYGLVVKDIAEDRGGLSEGLLRSSEILFSNGSRIIAVPANPSTARGYAANIVLDEFPHHDQPNATWGALYPSTTNQLAGTFSERWRAMLAGKEANHRRKLRVIVISTFNGRDNKFFELYDRAPGNGFSKHRITIYDAVADGMPMDIDKLKAGLDDPDAWAQEFECEPIDTSNVLLPYELLALAESADATETTDALFWQSTGNPVYCGIDFGRSHDPTVCWTLELIGGILWTREVLVLKNTETPEQVEALRMRIARSTRTSFDYTGPGVGCGDYLKGIFGLYRPESHEFGKVDLVTFTTKVKREMFPTLRRQFVAPTKLRTPISRLVREDLHAMQQVVNNGEYNYWAPHTREGHSDRCTALALAIRAADPGAGSIGCEIG